DRAGIEPPTEKHSKWHITHEMLLAHFSEELFKIIKTLLLTERLIREGEIPILLGANLPLLDNHLVSRQELVDTLKHRFRGWNIADTEIRLQRIVINQPRNVSLGQ